MLDRSRAVALAARTGLVGGWITVGALGWLTLSLVTGLAYPIAMVAAEAMAPVLLLPAWPIAVAGLVKRHWALGGVAATLAVVHVLVLLPVFAHGSRPTWLSTGPNVRILSANVKADNRRPPTAVHALLAQQVDVLVIIEATPRFVAQLDRQSVTAIYPFQSLHQQRTGYGTAIYSKLPLREVKLEDMNGVVVPQVQLTVGDTTLDLMTIHTRAPYAVGRLDEWRKNLSTLGQLVDQLPSRSVLVGDFNATRWHRPFAKLLDHGLTDAHLVTGDGLSRSWPNDRWYLPPLFRIDHALMRSGVTARSVRNVDIPGSDHIAFVVDLVIEPAKS